MSVLINFSTEYWDFLGRLNPDFHCVAVYSSDLDMDRVADDDALIHFSG
jgi:hypothetical protein